MSKFALELLSREHERAGFDCGIEPLNKYLRETARGHLEKGVSVTRVLEEAEASPPKPIAGYFTLSTTAVEITAWAPQPKGLPKAPVGAVLLGRLGVDRRWQGHGLGERLVGLACLFSLRTLEATGGIGLVVDASTEEVVSFYERFGFNRVGETRLRLFLPTASVKGAAEGK